MNKGLDELFLDITKRKRSVLFDALMFMDLAPGTGKPATARLCKWSDISAVKLVLFLRCRLIWNYFTNLVIHSPLDIWRKL